MFKIERTMLDIAENIDERPMKRVDVYLDLARLYQKDIHKCWAYITKAQDIAKLDTRIGNILSSEELR